MFSGMIIHHNNANKKKNTLGKLLGSDNAGGFQALNTKIHVTNFPATHTKDMIM
jgi:hypothetical protein